MIGGEYGLGEKGTGDHCVAVSVGAGGPPLTHPFGEPSLRLGPGPHKDGHMTWVKLDDRFALHPKVAGLTDRAFRVHVTALCYSGLYDTDGNIPRSVRRPSRATLELENAGLWEATETGWVIHDWTRYNGTSRSWQELRQKRSKAGSKGAAKRWHSDGNDDDNMIADPDPDPDPDLQRLEGQEPQSRDREFCQLLVDLMVGNGTKRPTVTKGWLTASRLLFDRDKREPSEAELVLRWCQQSPFWRANILSMPKFREKYDQLRLQMNPSGNGKAAGSWKAYSDLTAEERKARNFSPEQEAYWQEQFGV